LKDEKLPLIMILFAIVSLICLVSAQNTNNKNGNKDIQILKETKRWFVKELRI
jgi:hypothetical protein